LKNTQYGPDNLKFIKSKDQEGSIQIRDQYPAEFNNSKKYLGVKVYGKKGIPFRFFLQSPWRLTNIVSPYQLGLWKELFRRAFYDFTGCQWGQITEFLLGS
jgi:hypothetical protein